MSIIIENLKVLIFTSVAAAVFAGPGVCQSPNTRPVPPPRPELPRAETWRDNSERGRATYEKSIAVDPRVNLSLCVVEGNVNINGWSRNEVRIFVKHGSKLGFKVLQKSRQNESPVWIMAVGFDAKTPSGSSECLWGDNIEIDVPTNAAINIKGKETRTTIDSVRKANVKNIGGDIIIRNVAEGVSASTYEGDVAVENVAGAIVLESATGNIVAVDAGPSQVGDIFKAKTNSGAVSLQKLTHRQIEVNSISGSLAYNGDVSTGGTYSFGTSNGTITLGLPSNTSAALTASYGFGIFDSEIPLKDLRYGAPQSNVKSLSALMGAGNISLTAKLNLTTTSGRIAIRKQP